MRSRLALLVRQNRLLVTVFVLSLCIALWFGFHFTRDFLYFHDPRNVDVALKPWMTPRFIVLTYDLPRPLVFETLGLNFETEGGTRLGRVAAARGLTMAELTELVRDAAARFRDGSDG